MIIYTGVFVSKKTKETVSINFEMDRECNNLLNQSKSATKRSKTSEASLRLHDHLKRFPTQKWENAK